jgi:hypothetical protein
MYNFVDALTHRENLEKEIVKQDGPAPRACGHDQTFGGKIMEMEKSNHIPGAQLPAARTTHEKPVQDHRDQGRAEANKKESLVAL